MANAVKLIPKEVNYFYDNEILLDLRTRQEATLRVLESVPAEDPKHVGMQTINPKTNAGKYFVEFAGVSTIHGLNHLVAPHRHPIEKLVIILPDVSVK